MRVAWTRVACVVGVALLACALPRHGAAEESPKDGALDPLIHVPIEEIDVLLENGKKGVVLRYDAYRKLVAAARARAEALAAEAPIDGALVGGRGTIDLRGEYGELRFTHRVSVLGEGARSVEFRSRGVAIEALEIRPVGEAEGGRYEWRDGRPRLRFLSPGPRDVVWRGSVSLHRRGTSRLFDAFVPPAAGLAAEVVIPAGHEGSIHGEGAPLTIEPSPEVQRIAAVPERSGRLRISLRPASETEVGPPILDGTSTVVHTLGDGLASVTAVVRADVFRTPTSSLRLRVPESLAVHELAGTGVVSHTRSADRRTVQVLLAKPARGRIEVRLVGEQALAPEGTATLPRIVLPDAVRMRRIEIVQPREDVRLREVVAPRGRRLTLAEASGRPGVFAFQVAGNDADVRATIEPTGTWVESKSTWYWNMGEAGKTLIATTTYEVKRGRVFTLRPRFPANYELRALRVGGSTTGFRRDRRLDGTLEIHLGKDVKEGGRIAVVATLEEAQTDWLPEEGTLSVALDLPLARADRNEALVAVGADAAFEVVEKGMVDLESVGAGDLTQAGIEAAGLLYGYRVEGPAPALRYDVRRHAPYLEAAAVSLLQPTPRRLEITARAVHRIDRAGVRELYFDLPSWAGDEVRFVTSHLRAANPIDDTEAAALAAEPLAEGYRRWRVALTQRVIGTHVTTARYFLDRDEDDWRVAADRRLAMHVPVPRAERFLVLARAQGLEVRWDATPDDVQQVEAAELPAAARPSPQGLLAALRLTGSSQGLAFGVRKHEGAAVLDAIATRVELQTAVARSGTLRTRAVVELLNIHRQFLEVHLPENSALIGAVVNGQPVKPLRRGDHTLLVPVPTARQPGERARAALTYETRLGRPLDDEVTIPVPTFPGLEVMHTTQVVGLEPDVVVTEVEGAFVGDARHARPAPRPLIADMFGRSDRAGADTAAPSGSARNDPADAAMIRASSDDADDEQWDWADDPGLAPEATPLDRFEPVIRDEEIEETLESDHELVFEESFGETEGLADQPFSGPANNGTIGLAGGGRGMRPGRAGLPAAAAEPPERAPVPKPAADPGDGDANEGRDRADSEGGVSPFERQQRARAARRRKGLLSLDVPVWLAPNRVQVERLGSGGEIIMTFEAVDAPPRRRLLLTVLLLAAGFAVTRARGWRRFGVPALLILAGVTFRMTTGAGGSLLATALVDTGCILLFVYGVATLVRAVGGKRAVGATAAVLLSLGVCARAAHADEPRPETPDASPATPLYVPYDSDDEGAFEDGDQVFLPLETWRRLFHAAHPDQDPEVIRLGRTIALTDARGTLDVAGDQVGVTLTFRLVKRGKGMMLLEMPLAGLAITEATLGDRPVRLLLQKGKYLLALEDEGGHVLRLVAHVPVVMHRGVPQFAFQTLPFAATRYALRAPLFSGDIDVLGPGRVVPAKQGRTGFEGEVFPGAMKTMRFLLEMRRPDVLPETTVLRSDVDSLHTLRDDGTESQHDLRIRVLQGTAPFVDVDLDEAERVLEVRGGGVVRWSRREEAPGRIRLTFAKPLRDGDATIVVRTVRLAEAAARPVTLGAPWLAGATGGRGRVVVNAHPDARVRVTQDATYVRTARPRDEACRGPDRIGRVVGAWLYSARPRPLVLDLSRAASRIRIESVQAVAFGGDRVFSRFDALVRIERVALGDLVFDLPGEDEVRGVESPGLADWWLTGDGAERKLRLRYTDLVTGERALRVTLERDLDGRRDGLRVPRWALRGAQRDEGRLVVYALPDVEPAAGAVPGLQPLPLERARVPTPPVLGAKPVNAFLYQRPVADGLPVVLRTPDLALSASVTSLVAPGVERHQVEHLVLFEVRRGATDTVRFFLPSGGHDDATVVRTRDLREMRKSTVTREGPGGEPVVGTEYELILQSKRGGLIEVACSQVQQAGRTVRFPEPLGIEDSRWFAMVRTFLDGEVAVAPAEGSPERSSWSDLLFVPTGLTSNAVVRIYDAREPFALTVVATSHPVEAEAEAIILRAVADVALGRDGQARVRAHYRVFNRSRQFLRVRLPEGAVLFGATAAGRPVKPLQGAEATILVPIPKVPLGGVGYPVTLLYRVRAGVRVQDGARLRLELPEIPGLDVDRTAVRLLLPERHGYTFDGGLAAAEAEDVAADLALATLQEVRDLLEVARTGTLEQRVVSARNARALLQATGSVAARLKDQPEQLEVTRQYEDLKATCAVICGKAEADLASARSGQVGLNPSQVQFGGNAAELVTLDDDKPAGEAQVRMRGGAWMYNGAPESEPGQREEIVELKRAIEFQLRGRGGASRSRADATRRAANAAIDKDVRQEMAGSKQQADELLGYTDIYNSNFVGVDDDNVQALNEEVRRSQTKNRQLGSEAWNRERLRAAYERQVAAAGRPLANETEARRQMRDLPALLEPDLSVNMDPSRAPGVAQGFQLGLPSSGSGGGAAGFAAIPGQEGTGVEFVDGLRYFDFSGGVAPESFVGNGDWSYMIAATTRSGAGSGAVQEQRVTTRTGLMGVDVPLARVGKLYHFRGRGARVIEIDVEGEGSLVWLRVLILLLAAGVLAGGFWWGRRARKATPAVAKSAS